MVLHPVGPLPASTYWRRRAVLGIALLVVLLLLRSCLGGDSPSRRTGATASPSASSSPSAAPAKPSTGPTASPTPAASASRPCADSELRLVVSTDEATYAVGGTPTFTMVVTNAAATPCTRDLGPTVVSFLVVSGPARQWSSDDCQPASGHKSTVLPPGRATQVAQITWSGKTSRVGCPTPRATAEAGTYQLSGTVGTLTSARVVFHFR